jgi:osmotically-inducible protein OsmY
VHTDEQLQAMVRQPVLRDGRLSEQPIDVSVSGSVATLRGSVQSYGRRLAAAEIAASIDGITGVVDELHVGPPGNLPDEQIAQYVRHALDARADITRPTIAVTVNNGMVKLSGNVGNYWERILAGDTALGTKGVVGVKNMLIVDLEGQIEDEALSREIQETLSYTRGLRDGQVRVAVTGDTAVLSGNVEHLWQREMAEAVVRRFRASHVNNKIRVATGPNAEESG